MSTAKAKKGIYQKLADILADFPVVSKNHKNPSQKYNYRGIDDALAALSPLLAKHRVFLQIAEIDTQMEDAGTTKSGTAQVRAITKGKVRYVCGDTGESIENAIVGEGVDMGDKAVMKSQANALKYMLWYTFCVPTEGKKDSEAFEDPEPTKAPKRTKKKGGNTRGVDELIEQLKVADKTDIDELKAEARKMWATLEPGDERRNVLAQEAKAAEERLG